MDTAQHCRVIEVDWLAASPIGPHSVAFKRHLTERRYAEHTVSTYLAEVTHFARWVCTRRLPLARIDDVSVAISLDDHLPGCACTGHCTPLTSTASFPAQVVTRLVNTCTLSEGGHLALVK